jgi:hypothetical protein
LAQSCAWRGAAARGRRRAAARNFRALGLVFGWVIGMILIMPRSLVRGVPGDKAVQAICCKEIEMHPTNSDAG